MSDEHFPERGLHPVGFLANAWFIPRVLGLIRHTQLLLLFIIV